MVSDIDRQLRELLAQPKIMALAFQLKTNNRISPIIIDQIMILLFSENMYEEDGRHVFFSPLPQNFDMNIFYHSARYVTDRMEYTEGSILNSFSPKCTALKAPDDHRAIYLQNLLANSPLEHKPEFLQLSNLPADQFAAFGAAIKADKRGALAALYYGNPNDNYFSPQVIAFIRWIRFMGLPYLSIYDDIPDIKDVLSGAKPLAAEPEQKFALGFGVFRNNMILMLLSLVEAYRELIPRMIIEGYGKTINALDIAYEGSTITPNLLNYSSFKVQIPILFSNVLTELKTTIRYDSELIDEYVYPAELKDYFICGDEKSIKYRAAAKLAGQNVNLASGQAQMLEAFFRFGRFFGNAQNTLTEIDPTTGVAKPCRLQNDDKPDVAQLI